MADGRAGYESGQWQAPKPRDTWAADLDELVPDQTKKSGDKDKSGRRPSEDRGRGRSRSRSPRGHDNDFDMKDRGGGGRGPPPRGPSFDRGRGPPHGGPGGPGGHGGGGWGDQGYDEEPFDWVSLFWFIGVGCCIGVIVTGWYGFSDVRAVHAVAEPAEGEEYKFFGFRGNSLNSNGEYGLAVMSITCMLVGLTALLAEAGVAAVLDKIPQMETVSGRSLFYLVFGLWAWGLGGDVGYVTGLACLAEVFFLVAGLSVCLPEEYYSYYSYSSSGSDEPTGGRRPPVKGQVARPGPPPPSAGPTVDPTDVHVPSGFFNSERVLKGKLKAPGETPRGHRRHRPDKHHRRDGQKKAKKHRTYAKRVTTRFAAEILNKRPPKKSHRRREKERMAKEVEMAPSPAAWSAMPVVGASGKSGGSNRKKSGGSKRSKRSKQRRD